MSVHRDSCFFMTDAASVREEAVYRASKFAPQQQVAFLEMVIREVRSEIDSMLSDPLYAENNT